MTTLLYGMDQALGPILVALRTSLCAAGIGVMHSGPDGVMAHDGDPSPIVWLGPVGMSW
jgi:hypothetical protein